MSGLIGRWYDGGPPDFRDLAPSVPVLITGVGYIGAALAAGYLARGEQVVGLENFFSTPRPALHSLLRQPGFRLVRGSVTAPAALRRAFELGPFEVVHHLAAQASAHPDAAPTTYTERTNLIGARLLLDAAAEHGAGAVSFGSSFHVYGRALRGTVDEDAPYGAFGDLTHLGHVYVEKLFEMYAPRFAHGSSAVRLGVVYGLGPVMKRDPRFMTVPNLFAARAALGQPLQVHSRAAEPIGFVHLDDACRGLVQAGARPEAGYLVANAVGEVKRVAQVAALVQSIAAKRGLEVTIQDEAGQPLPGLNAPHSGFEVRSRLSELGWTPRERMADRLGEVLDYFRRACA